MSDTLCLHAVATVKWPEQREQAERSTQSWIKGKINEVKECNITRVARVNSGCIEKYERLKGENRTEQGDRTEKRITGLVDNSKWSGRRSFLLLIRPSRDCAYLAWAWAWATRVLSMRKMEMERTNQKQSSISDPRLVFSFWYVPWCLKLVSGQLVLGQINGRCSLLSVFLSFCAFFAH